MEMQSIITRMSETDKLQKMVERVPWMQPIHYEILAFYEEHDIWESARDLSRNIDYSRGYTSKELNTMVEAGLLEKDERIYRLSERGRSFLAGELDADDLPDPSESSE